MLDFNSTQFQDSVGAFRQAMLNNGIQPPARIMMDGNLHRFDIERGDKAGWYVFHSANGSPAAGAFGNWKSSDEAIKWCAKERAEMSPIEYEQYTQTVTAQQQKYEQEEEQKHAAARKKAARIWADATTDNITQHPYIQKKQITPHGIRLHEGHLIIPAVDSVGEIHTLHTIDDTGRKLFLAGGKKQGHFFEFDGNPDSIYICEGYATGASIREVIGNKLVIAFDAGNLRPVAEAMKAKYPRAELVICADNDQWKPGNPGVAKATMVAEQIGARLIVPQFKDTTNQPTDFNDLHVQEGIEALKTQILGTQPAYRVNILDWSVDRYAGPAPERTWLVNGIFPMGAVSIFAALGDAGKGMMTLDLAIKVAKKKPQTVLNQVTAFGGDVAVTGSAVIVTVEDDFDEVHRRLEGVDPGMERANRDGKLLIIPLPNAGGPMPLVIPGKNGPEESMFFRELKAQFLQIKDLKLIVFDPLASFVAADINADPAVGSFTTGLLSSLATETGAAVIVVHHMSKGNQDKPVKGPEHARSLIRGTTAIIDGARGAYALWPAQQDPAKRICARLSREYKPNGVFMGAVVKSNGPAAREVQTYVRSDTSGLLEPMNEILKNVHLSQGDFLEVLADDIANAAENGRPFSHTGAAGVYKRREELSQEIKDIGKHRLEEMVQDLLNSKTIGKAISKGGPTPKWLDVPYGPFGTGKGEFAEGFVTK